MKLLRQLAGALAGLGLATAAVAQGYPSKPVRIVVAYQAGQGTDVATRHFAEQLTKALGQSFYVENRPGAGGNLGTEAAARATPDGYTLTMGTNATHGTNQFLYSTPAVRRREGFRAGHPHRLLPDGDRGQSDAPREYHSRADRDGEGETQRDGRRDAEHDRAHRVRAVQGAEPGAVLRRALQGLGDRDDRGDRRPAAAHHRYGDGGAAAGREREAESHRGDLAQGHAISCRA